MLGIRPDSGNGYQVCGFPISRIQYGTGIVVNTEKGVYYLAIELNQVISDKMTRPTAQRPVVNSLLFQIANGELHSWAQLPVIR